MWKTPFDSVFPLGPLVRPQMYGSFKRPSVSTQVQINSTAVVPGFNLGDHRFKNEMLSDRGKFSFTPSNIFHSIPNHMRNNNITNDGWENSSHTPSRGSNNREQSLAISESYENKL